MRSIEVNIVESQAKQFIHLHKVGTNNLQNIDAKFPLHKLSVVTGVSGSGKSSLVFDTLFAESYRRYIESLSSYARQYIKSLPKPNVQFIKDLPPAVAVRQFRGNAHQRSTVGTMTEIQDLLQILFCYLSTVTCSNCHTELQAYDAKILTDTLLQESQTPSMKLIGAPLAGWKSLDSIQLKQELLRQGFVRIWQKDRGLIELSDFKKNNLHACYVVVDHLMIDADNQERILESVQTAFQIGKHHLVVIDEKKSVKAYANTYYCVPCDKKYLAPNFSLFSFNHPLGACPTCQGYGKESLIDWNTVIDQDKSIYTKGIIPLRFGDHEYYYKLLTENADKLGVDVKKKFKDYSASETKWLKFGDGNFKGIDGYFQWLKSKSYKPHFRMHYAKFRYYKTCKECAGKRFNQNVLVYHVNGKTVVDLMQMSIEDLGKLVRSLEKAAPKNSFEQDVLTALDELRSRLAYLLNIGVGYLTLERDSKTLSGGELQRIHMARCLGNQFTETLYCLDEPTAGLHAQDTNKLMEVLKDLSMQGNTVVVVEHDSHVISQGDYCLELGPGAGHLGGQVVASGVQHRKKTQEKNLGFLLKEKPLNDFVDFLQLKDVTTHNLKNIETKIPLGCLVGVCGVSGSGKTSLIQHTLYPLLKEKLHVKKKKAVEIKANGVFSPRVLSRISDVYFVSQAPLARSTRSTIATYLGIYQDIRNIFSRQESAKKNQLKPGDFSFNVPGGRCEACKGLGTILEDLSFLGEVEIVCPACEGKRFKEKVLEVRFQGLNLLDVLSLTVERAREVFFRTKKIVSVLDRVMEVGLGYMTLGQNLSSFSGGEAQRLKLLSLTLDVKKDKPSLLIFDEPTAGLSDVDVKHLLQHFYLLIAKGHSIIAIEHHIAFLHACNWLIELGPKAALAGGKLIYEGPMQGLLQVKNSPTRPFIANLCTQKNLGDS